MAVLALAAAGAWLAPAGYAAVGWAVGSAIGSMLQGPTKVQGQQQSLMDLKVTGTEYGQAIPYVRGAAAIAGQMWWNTDRRPTTTTTTESSGGKGGGGVETSTNTITYDMDCLIGLTDNEIVGIARIWDNGKLIYTADSGATAGSIEASSATEHWTRLTVYTGSATQLPDPTYEAAVGAANAPAYRGRSYVFIESLKLGQSGQVPNLTFEVVADGTSQPAYSYTPIVNRWDGSNKNVHLTIADGGLAITSDGTAIYMSVAATNAESSGILYCEMNPSGGAGSSRRIGLVPDYVGVTNNGFLPGSVGGGCAFDSSAVLKFNEGVSEAYGSYISWPNEVIGMIWNADLGTVSFVNNITGNMGVAFTGIFGPHKVCWGGYGAGYVPHEVDLDFPNFGATAWINPTLIPAGAVGWTRTVTTYLADTVTVSTPTITEVVSDLCVRAGLTAGQIDVTALASITRAVRGFAISQIAPTRQVLELLMSAYFFEMTLSDKLYFRPRGGSSVASIPYLDLGASTSDELSEPLALHEANDLEIPAQIALSYINVSDDYQTGTELSDRLISATSGTVAAVQMALGMTPAEAKAVADTMLLDQYASRWSAPIALLGDYCRLEPTDPVLVTGADGSIFRLRIVKKTDSYPLLTFETVLDDVSVLTSQGITSADYTSSTVVAAAVNTEMELMDIPILQDADNDPGFYVAAKGDGTPYPGSAIFNSADNVEYVRKATVLESAVFGTCTTTLGNWTGGRVFDEMNSVTVDVGDGTLASSTRDAILNSLAVNAMLIGSELIQFRTVTLVSAGVYTLTGLLRGGRGTEWAMTGHASAERCVLLRAAGLRRIAMLNSELGLSRYYKGVTLGRAVSTATAEQFTDNAIGLKPFSPFDLRAIRDGSNNIIFTWQRRTRLAVRMIGALGISVPLGEDSASYEIEIYASGAYATVVHTISATSETATYSAAEQTADGLTPGNTVYCKVYQLSAQIGRGYLLQQAA